jgi:hypothetical protein
VALLSFWTGCAHDKAPKKKRASVQIVTRAEAESRKLVARTLDDVFFDGENGTTLLLHFLAVAGRHRAKVVSDLQLDFLTKHDGQTRRCTLRIGPAGSLKNEPTNDTQRTTEVSETRVSCHLEYQPVLGLGPSYDPYMPTGPRTVNILTQRCAQYRATEDVTRWTTQLEAAFVPPDLKIIEQEHAQTKLEEGAPVCTTLTATISSTVAPHRIRARVYL